MQVVIDIDKTCWDWLRNGFPDEDDGEYAIKAIVNGIPLPKNHGRIMDVDKVIKKMEEREEQLKDNKAMYETACVETALDIFGEIIIEADKE